MQARQKYTHAHTTLITFFLAVCCSFQVYWPCKQLKHFCFLFGVKNLCCFICFVCREIDYSRTVCLYNFVVLHCDTFLLFLFFFLPISRLFYGSFCLFFFFFFLGTHSSLFRSNECVSVCVVNNMEVFNISAISLIYAFDLLLLLLLEKENC